MKKDKKILIIRFNAIGDVAMTTIVPYSIKLKHPDCEIHYLTSLNNSQLLNNCPYVDKVMVYNDVFKDTIKALRRQKYDVIISLNYTKLAYLLTFLSFPKRFVFKSLKGTSWVENYFYTAKKVYNDITMPDRLYLINKDKGLELGMSKIFAKYPRPYILISPGKYYKQIRQGRVWNLEKYKELSNKILDTYGGTVFVIGSAEEKPYHSTIEDKNIVILSGKYNLEESCTLISLSDLVISGDSGPAHVASAYNRKVIALLGSTSPDKIKPYGNNGYYIGPKTSCKYCWKKKCKYLEEKEGYAPCIESITPDMVMDKIKENNLLEIKQ